MSRRTRQTSSVITVFVIVLLSLQIFLMTVALDGLLAGEPRLSWASAALSVVLAAGAIGFYRYLR